MKAHSDNKQPTPDVSNDPDQNHADTIDPSNAGKHNNIDSDSSLEESTASPCKADSNKESSEQQQPCLQSTNVRPTIIVHSPHSSTFTILIVLLSLVLGVALLVVAWRLCVVVRNNCGQKRPAKYKSVSKYFPFSYGHTDPGSGVAIPEYGLPKNRAAEREILLNDSDEDEL